MDLVAVAQLGALGGHRRSRRGDPVFQRFFPVRAIGHRPGKDTDETVARPHFRDRGDGPGLGPPAVFALGQDRAFRAHGKDHHLGHIACDQLLGEIRDLFHTLELAPRQLLAFRAVEPQHVLAHRTRAQERPHRLSGRVEHQLGGGVLHLRGEPRGEIDRHARRLAARKHDPALLRRAAVQGADHVLVLLLGPGRPGGDETVLRARRAVGHGKALAGLAVGVKHLRHQGFGAQPFEVALALKARDRDEGPRRAPHLAHRPRDVDAAAAGFRHRGLAAQLFLGDHVVGRGRPVERGVEGDGEDVGHVGKPVLGQSVSAVTHTGECGRRQDGEGASPSCG